MSRHIEPMNEDPDETLRKLESRVAGRKMAKSTTPTKRTTESKAEEMLLADLRAIGLEPVLGYMFHSELAYRFDFSWPPLKLAVEVEGRGRHQSYKGFEADCQKYNAALELGWRVLRYPATRVTTHKRRARIVEQIHRIICGVECEDSAACVLVGE